MTLQELEARLNRFRTRKGVPDTFGFPDLLSRCAFPVSDQRAPSPFFGAQRVNSSDNVYVLRASSDLRIFFRLEADRIVILDITTKELILKFGHVSEPASHEDA